MTRFDNPTAAYGSMFVVWEFWGGGVFVSWGTRSGVAKTFARYRGHLGPSGRKLQIEFEKEFPGLLGFGAQVVQNGVENESKSTIFPLF